MTYSTLYRYFDAAVHAQFNLAFVVWTSIGLFWLVILMSLYMLCYRTYYHIRRRYEASRKALYDPAVEQVIMEEPLEEIIAALKPRRWGDEMIVQGVILEAARHLTGPPFLVLKSAAENLGVVARNLKELRSKNPHKRGRAMEAIGILRCAEASGRLKELLMSEPMNLKLVALRALTAIGDPAILPSFVEVSDRLQPSVMMRLAALMLEFGRPGRQAIVALVNRHPEGFHPRALAELLRELASNMESNP